MKYIWILRPTLISDEQQIVTKQTSYVDNWYLKLLVNTI